jgi:hypothetical protein
LLFGRILPIGKTGKLRIFVDLHPEFDDHGIEMKVGGCGCCGSPWITFKYKGETIIDDDDYGFDTEEVTPNSK